MAWTTPRTWLSGESLTAALLNVHVRDNLSAIGDPWTAYTPEWVGATTDPVIGNGTITGHYTAAGKLIHARIEITVGSTTTLGSGSYRFGLPVAGIFSSAWLPLGTGVIYDDSTATRYFRDAATADANRLLLADQAGSQMTNTSPLTLAVDDKILITVTYEAA